MSEPFTGPFPKPPLIAAAVLLVGVVALVFVARVTGAGAMQNTGRPAASIAAAELRFTDRDDGSVAVHAVGIAAPIARLEPGSDGFVRATMRSLARERRQHGANDETPFELAMSRDGRLTLFDPSTQRRLDLGAFGPTNAAAFARLLDAARASRRNPS